MSVAAGSSLLDLGFPFMPSDPDRRGVVVEAGEGWSFDASVWPEAEVVVWARLSDRSPLPEAARHAVARHLALHMVRRRLPPGWRVVGVHPVPPRQLRSGGPRSRVASALRGGALVELTTLPDGGRVLDTVAVAAGAIRLRRPLHLAAGGGLVARIIRTDGSAAVLRVGRSGTAGDPAPVAATLQRLARAGLDPVPLPLAQGSTSGVSWLAESTLPGRRPRRLTPALLGQVAEACARFPAAGGPPTALADDLAGIAGHLPERAPTLSRLAGSLEARAGSWPGVLCHGDLWLGNLLVRRGRLSALLDWDGAHPAAVPGTDLVHLVALDALVRHGIRFGATFLHRPWQADGFRRVTAPYWAALGVPPDPDLLELAGIAWWASAVHGTLTRFPARGRDPRWVSANVDPVLAALCGTITRTA